MTAIHWACKKNNLDMTELLLSFTPDLETKDIVNIFICKNEIFR